MIPSILMSTINPIRETKLVSGWEWAWACLLAGQADLAGRGDSMEGSDQEDSNAVGRVHRNGAKSMWPFTIKAHGLEVWLDYTAACPPAQP
jgi:hypothetical protein